MIRKTDRSGPDQDAGMGPSSIESPLQVLRGGDVSIRTDGRTVALDPYTVSTLSMQDMVADQREPDLSFNLEVCQWAEDGNGRHDYKRESSKDHRSKWAKRACERGLPVW